MITKADKGNSVVILPKSDTVNKVNNLNSHSRVLNKYPTNIF